MSKGKPLFGDFILQNMNDIKIIKNEDIIEGVVLAIDRARVYIDLKEFGTGIIYGSEYINAREMIKKISLGDTISAKVIMRENEDGYVELSLKEARQALIWSDAEAAIKDKRVMDLVVKDANKGGLMLDWQGISGFLPASQLKDENYPKVSDGDKDQILRALKQMIGKRLSVSIIGVIPKEGKLIFSERVATGESAAKDMEAAITKSGRTVGEVIDGVVTGVVDFGIFVKLPEGIEGLVHKSEIDWGLVEDPRSMFKVGDKLKARVIEIKEGKISLSIKALKENPWKEYEGKLKKGDIVGGVVIKYNKHGALVSIKEGVAGLVHNSTFGTESKLREKLELGKNYNFQITMFEPKDHKMTLVHLEK